jgi:hypothetical protein
MYIRIRDYINTRCLIAVYVWKNQSIIQPNVKLAKSPVVKIVM